MATVGIRELKSHLSQYLARVRKGERLIVSDRGRAIAVVASTEAVAQSEAIAALLRSGGARWTGGKPRGLSRPIVIDADHLVSTAVLDDRR